MSPPDAALTPDELRAALKLAVSTFYKYQAMGNFDRFELERIGPRRYSRKAVQAYLDRDEPVRVFGRKRSAVG